MKNLILEQFTSRLTHLQWQSLVPFAATLVTFFGAAVASVLLQYYRHRKTFTLIGFFKHCFPVEGWKTKSSRIDLIMYFAGKLIKGLLAVGDAIITFTLAGGVVALLTWLFPGHTPIHAGFTTIIVWSVVFFLFADFSNFLTHYWQHKYEFLWELHKVHHSATFLSPLTTARMHPLGDKLDHLGTALIISVPAGIAMFEYRFSVTDLLIMFANANLIGTILVLDALRHSQFPVSFGALDRFVMSPHMHQLHHSAKYEHWDHNMGNKLSIWDWMFGTAMIPPKNEPLTYGIGRGAEFDAQYDSLYGVYIGPVVGLFKVLAGSAPKELPPPQSLQEAGLTEPSPPSPPQNPAKRARGKTVRA